VELLNGYITASVAKLNEFYLRNADYEKRRYTMCHELGHGFGLVHTDENPHNEDLGNCLDYTDSPGNNLLPGSINFERLRQLYGSDDQGSSGAPQGSNIGNRVVSSAFEEEQDVAVRGGKTRKFRRLVRRYIPRSHCLRPN